MSFCPKDWAFWQIAFGIVYIGSLGMMIAGSVLCSGNSEYVCFDNDCSDDDDDGGSGTNSWGPCGLDYTGSSSSTCETHCGNSTGVVCTKRDYDCGSNIYSSGFYCRDATRECVDPTALSLVIIGSVFFGAMSLTLLFLYFSCKKTPDRNQTGTRGNHVEEPPVAIGEVIIEGDPIAVASNIPIHRADVVEGAVANPSFDPPIAKPIK